MRKPITYSVLFTYGVLVLFTVAPILSVCVAELIASACGCQLDEGGAHPCIIHGVDIGPLLGDMFVCGWFMLVTIPVGVASLLGFTLVIVIRGMWLRWGSSSNRAKTSSEQRL
jgi:hypothetical protein